MALAAMAKGLPSTKFISGAVLLAPVAFVTATRSETLAMLADLDVPAMIRKFGVRSFLPCSPGSSLVFSQICTYLPSFCQAFLQELAGKSQSLNASRIPLYLDFLPAGASLTSPSTAPLSPLLLCGLFQSLCCQVCSRNACMFAALTSAHEKSNVCRYECDEYGALGARFEEEGEATHACHGLRHRL
jgi:hypothetical protein